MICEVGAGLSIIAAVGLDFEAAAARGPGVDVAIGLNRKIYIKTLREKAANGSLGIISFGIAGGLSPGLKPGDAVIATSVMTSRGTYDTCPVWFAALSAALPKARPLPVYGSERPLLTVSDKRAFWLETGAAIVDMESRDAALVAAEHGLPLAVLRVVLDSAHRSIPPSALAGVNEQGKTRTRDVIKALAKRPQDLQALIRLGIDAQRAIYSLLRCRAALGPGFSFARGEDRAAARSTIQQVRHITEQSPNLTVL